MGISDSGGGGERGAGSIVWVRRRNGSWWPGKIMSPTDFSSSLIMSPRSGTPVKLLGRNDASVDWYNLEKSKRVKAFRCGEFDDCIEKAEASFGLPTKKREKYAQREDAVLHALELEKKLLEKKQHGNVGTLNSVRKVSSSTKGNGLATPSELVENGNGNGTNKASGVTRLCLQEHNNESVHGIDGLKEIKLKTGIINKQNYTSAASFDPNSMVIDSHSVAASDNDPSYENFSDSDSRSSIGKRKRLLEGLIEEPFSKRHNRHHTEFNDYSFPSDGGGVSMCGKEQFRSDVRSSMYLTPESLHITDTNHNPQRQFGISATQVEVGDCYVPRDSCVVASTSESSEETVSDSSETHSAEHIDARMLISDAETHIRRRPVTLDPFVRQSEHESTSSDESDELSLDDRSQFYAHGQSPSDAGVSKWQLKGKRNIRNCSKRDRSLFSHRTDIEGEDRSLNPRNQRHGWSYYHDNDYCYDVDYIEDGFSDHSKGFNGRGYLASQAVGQRKNCVDQSVIDWVRGGCYSSTFVSRNGEEILIDVEVEVEANRQGEHVPWVSLMSRLNGMAIIGHPIQIEPIEDGSTDIVVCTSDLLQYDDIDRNRVQPAWRTGRRTANVRVPRHHVSSNWDGDDDDVDNQCFLQSGKVKKTQGAKKPLRKANSSLIQKTKALSPIGYDQRRESRKYYMDGVIKGVDAGPPTVACIPVKLVFSRLLEAVGRLPSGPPLNK